MGSENKLSLNRRNRISGKRQRNRKDKENKGYRLYLIALKNCPGGKKDPKTINQSQLGTK